MPTQKRVIEVMTLSRAPDAFVAPKSIDEANNRRVQLLREIEEVDVMLKDFNLTDPQGRRLSPNAYNDRRRQLTLSQTNKRSEVRQLNTWIKEHNRTSSADVRHKMGEGDWALLARALLLFEELEDKGTKLPKEAEVLMDIISNKLSPDYLSEATRRLEEERKAP